MTKFFVAVALMFLLAGCSSADQQGSKANQVSNWINGTALGATVATLQGDVAHVKATLAANGSASQFHTVCGVFLTDVEDANTVLPTPDTTLTNLLSSAYEALGRAANACYEGGTPSSPAMVAFRTNEAAALISLAKAIDRAQLIANTVVETTTTTPVNVPSGGL